MSSIESSHDSVRSIYHEKKIHKNPSAQTDSEKRKKKIKRATPPGKDQK